MSPMSPRLLRPRATGFVSPDADARAYLAAVRAADNSNLEPAVSKAISDFVIGLKADGIWSAIKASCILAGARTLAGALVPLVGSAPTNNGPFVSGDYNRKTGLVGNGTSKYLDTNRAGNADPQNDYHNAVYSQGGVTINGIYLGSGQFGIAGSTQLASASSAGAVVRTRSRAGTIDNLSAADTGGLIGVSRSGDPGFAFRVSGTAGTNTTRVSGTPTEANFFVFATNGPAITPVASRLAFYSIGESLDLALLDSRVSALITAIGAAIP